MGSGQSSAEAEREVTVEEMAGDDGQPQIIVTQDFLEYVQDRQNEEVGGKEGAGRRRNRPPPPPLPDSPDNTDIPHLTTNDMISGALSGGRRGGGGDGGREEKSLWQRKYEMEREKNADLKHVTENEFAKTVDEVREKFTEAGVEDMLPVCDERRNKVLQCYHSNRDKPLLCSSEVGAFSECVERARQKLLQAK